MKWYWRNHFPSENWRLIFFHSGIILIIDQTFDYEHYRQQSERTGRTWTSYPGLYLQVNSMSTCWYHWNSKFWPLTGSGFAIFTLLVIHNFCWKVISHTSTSDHKSSLNSAKLMVLGNNESSWKYLSYSSTVGLHINESKSSGKPQNSGFFFFLYGKKQITMLCHFKSLIARWCAHPAGCLGRTNQKRLIFGSFKGAVKKRN